MPRPRPPRLHRETTRHGRTVWYVRVGRGPRVRITAAFGTPEFDSEYQAAISGAARRQKGTAGIASLEWLVTRYRETKDWSALSQATRRQRDNIFKHVIEPAGREHYRKLPQDTLFAGKARRAAKTAHARKLLDALRAETVRVGNASVSKSRSQGWR